MVSQSPSGKSRRVPEAVAQQSLLQQAQAANAAQDNSGRQTMNEALIEEADLNTSDGAENDMPPPAYGDTYGEIRNEKDGLGASASVTDDGRVNISINQLNRRLSQVFTPALRQDVQDTIESRPPPPCYVPPSLGGKKGVPPPPALNIVIQVVGSRGDVQPFVALGKVLKDTYGHRVRLATHPTFRNFVRDNGLEFFSIGGDPTRLMAFMVQNPSLMPGFRSVVKGNVGQRRKDVAEYIQGCWRSCYKAGDGTDEGLSELSESGTTGKHFVADCIIANPPSFAHIHCAEKMGVPLHIMFTMPYSPTQAFPHPLANIQSSNADAQLTNYISYAMIEILSWQGLGDIINRFRAKCLGLDPVSLIWAPGMLHRLRVPHTYCWSPALIPKPKDWGSHISVSGFYFLESASDYTPPPNLQTFLDAGPPPVYIGFGSIVLDDPNAMTELIFDAARKTGQRVLLSKGWGGMGADELRVPDGVFMLGNTPHDWLFKHVSCVVHHGGAGTTAAGISAGRPTLIVPFFGDQPFWGAMVARAGAGPDPIPHKQLTADRLADAINFCLKPETLERAQELASKIAAERGSDVGAQSLHQYLEVDRLRCLLAPSRVAVWRIKRTQIRLSAFAACTLASANYLNFDDLKLFRAQEYSTDEGPWDPISGGAAACYRAFSRMALGVAEFPTETLKPLYNPIRSSRQHSQESVATAAGKGDRTAPSPATGSSSNSKALQDPSASEGPDGIQNHPNNQKKTSFNKDRDMLRQTSAHSSKGLGRIAKSFVEIPMEVSVGLTKGFHNFPKLWGDNTVRPQEQVTDLKSGAMAAGKEFGYGWYDGVTGLVTQPWDGAQKEGVGGFVKGIGKGLGGFVAKPLAGFSGILGHTMKGVHKEVQNLFGNNAQSYIIASRVTQGYDEWARSSDVDKQEVIDRWQTIQKYRKKKGDPDGMVQDILDAQRKKSAEDTENHRNSGPTAASLQASNGANGSTRNPEQLLGEDADMERAIQENASQLHQQRPEAADHHADEEILRQAIVSSEAEALRHESEASEYGKQLQRALAQSLREQQQNIRDNETDSNVGLDDEEHEVSERARGKAAAVTGGSTSAHRLPATDVGHLAGTTQDEFEAQQQAQQGEKTAQDKTEEEIVMEYVKKQSLLEAYHQGKGKGRATTEGQNE